MIFNLFILVIQSELVISICAIVISIIGISFGAYFNYKNLKNSVDHNKRSIQPYIAVLTKTLNDQGHICIIKNVGLGPAVIESVDFVYENNVYRNIFEMYSNNFDRYNLDMNPEMSEATLLVQDEILGVNSSLELFNLKFRHGSNYNVSNFLKYSSKAKIKIKFSNLYGESMIHCEPLSHLNYL